MLVSGPEKALPRVAPDGTTSSYADLSDLSSYGGNDIVVDGRSNAWVNSCNGMASVSGQISFEGQVLSVPVSVPGAGWPAR